MSVIDFEGDSAYIAKMTKKRFLYWRITNTILLIFALLSPWKVVCSDMIATQLFCFQVPGWKSILISVSVVVESSELSGYLPGRLINLGELILVLYIGINCILLLTNYRLPTKRLQALLLIIVILSFLLLLRIDSPGFNTGLTWGYWLTCVTLFSGLFLEILGQLPLKSFKNEKP